jgi:putative transposase
VHHSDRDSQSVPGHRLHPTPRGHRRGAVGRLGATASINALAESVNGLYKTERIGRGGPWRCATDVEVTTAEWVEFYNKQRLHGALRVAQNVSIGALSKQSPTLP